MLFISIALLLAGCTPSTDAPPSPPPGPTIEEFIQQTNQIHSDRLNHLVTDLSPYQREFPGELAKDAGFSEEELAAMVNYQRQYFPKNVLSAEQAAHDVDILFRLFYYTFALYEYYGGQETFDRARQEVEADLAGRDRMTAGQLEEILRTRLSFITDGHAFLNNQLFSPHQRYFYNEEIALFPTEDGGYMAQFDDGAERLLSVNGAPNVDDWIFPSISEEGGLVWYPGFLAPSGSTPVEAVFQFEKSSRHLFLQEAQPNGYELTPTFTESRQGIPTVALRNFIEVDSNSEFIKTGKPLSEAPVAILDLRGNGGGQLYAVESWLHAYGCGSLTSLAGDDSGIFLETRASSYLMAHDYPKRLPFALANSPEGFYKSKMDYYRLFGNNSKLRQPSALPVKVESEKILFVLMDSVSMSSQSIWYPPSRAAPMSFLWVCPPKVHF